MKDLQLKRLAIIKDLALGYLVYTVFLTFSFFLDLLNLNVVEFITLLTFVWCGNIFYFLSIKTKMNLKLSEPDLFMPMMIWAIFCIIAPTYFMSSTLRSIFMMNYFLVAIFGVFRLNLKQFVILTGFAITTLGFVVVFTMKNKPTTINIYNEMLLLVMFTITSISFSFICNSVSNLRERLKNQKIELLTAFSDIHKISITDELTGVYNRRYAMDFIANKKLKADKGMDKFIACIFDIDFFKKINDTYGHDVGDHVLKIFSQEVNNLIRHDDCFARIGGEEFILILSHIDLEIAKEVIGRIMKTVRGIIFHNHPDLRITVSVGMSAYEKGTNVEVLLKNIDKLLYEAKRTGRDKVVYE